MNDIVVLY